MHNVFEPLKHPASFQHRENNPIKRLNSLNPAVGLKKSHLYWIWQ